ncbi:phage tail protein [Deinococcus apachensis]|uniref:phage tail protein n=1 Tax=Deinococcus apachensis TaxID=309886 RepID=UPI00037F8343|nr:tail fiber protein [Deinococcus apachensis]
MNGRYLRNIILGLVLGGAGLAATSVPNIFQAGSVISSGQVNQNFAALASAVDGVQANVDRVAGRFGGGASGLGPSGCLSSGYVGQVFMFAGEYGPEGAMVADGRLLPIAQNVALFSILGTRYGGDGKTTFALPDLRDVVPRSANGVPVNYFICDVGIYPSRKD